MRRSDIVPFYGSGRPSYNLSEHFHRGPVSERSELAMGGDDAELVRRHLAGDPSAFRTLYEKYGEKVFASAYRIVGEYHAAADLVQEVFVKIHRELKNFKFESKFSTWLFRVTVNHAINRSSQGSRHARLHEKIGRGGRCDAGGAKACR